MGTTLASSVQARLPPAQLPVAHGPWPDALKWQSVRGLQFPIQACGTLTSAEAPGSSSRPLGPSTWTAPPCGRPHREAAGIDQGKDTAAAGWRCRLGRASRTCLPRAYAWPGARQSHPSGLQERYAMESSANSTLHQAATAARRLPRSGGCSAQKSLAAQPAEEGRAFCGHSGNHCGRPGHVQSHFKLTAGDVKDNAESTRLETSFQKKKKKKKSLETVCLD